MHPLVELTAVFATTWLTCQVARWMFPVPHDDFRGFMARRTVQMLGRIAIVLSVIAVSVGWLGFYAPLATVGALAAWLIVSGIEMVSLQSQLRPPQSEVEVR